MSYRETHYNELDSNDGFAMIGEAVQILFIQSSGYLQGLRWVKEALDNEDIEGAKRSVNNALNEIDGGGLHANIENLGYLLEVCIPRKPSTEEPHSYG